LDFANVQLATVHNATSTSQEQIDRGTVHHARSSTIQREQTKTFHT